MQVQSVRDCGCPVTWLIDIAGDSDGAWDRRVLQKPTTGDYHLTPSDQYHLWDGHSWLTCVLNPELLS